MLLPPQDSAARSAPSTGSRRILVVDDHREAAEALAELLRIYGHEVETAYDGGAAVEHAARFEPDVVVLDLELPGIDGCEAARRIRAEDGAVMLIALSGRGEVSDRRRTKAAGFDHHLTKPLELAVLGGLLVAPPATPIQVGPRASPGCFP